MQKNKTIIWSAGVFILLAGLFLYPRIFGNGGAGNSSSGVPCLVPNLPLVEHIHPQLTIIVDDKPEIIPAGIGMSLCEKAIHTHDEDAGRGIIHVEAQVKRDYVLADFYDVWGKPISREGYHLEITVDGEAVQNAENIILKDEQRIAMKYTKI